MLINARNSRADAATAPRPPEVAPWHLLATLVLLGGATTCARSPAPPRPAADDCRGPREAVGGPPGTNFDVRFGGIVGRVYNTPGWWHYAMCSDREGDTAPGGESLDACLRRVQWPVGRCDVLAFERALARAQSIPWARTNAPRDPTMPARLPSYRRWYLGVVEDNVRFLRVTLECPGGLDFPDAYVDTRDGGDCVVNGKYDRDHDTLVGFGVNGQ